MASISDYLELELLDHTLGNGAYVQPTIYVALSTADPTEDGSGLAEPTYTAYARVAHAVWATAAARATSNTGSITFAQKDDGISETISHYAIYDAITAGNMLAHGDFTTAKAIVVGNTPQIATGGLDVDWITGGISTYLSNALLDHVFENTAYTVPTNLYVGLSTADPTDDGSGITEPAANYARVNHNAWDTALLGASENTGVVTFPTPSATWGTVTHHFLHDATGAGNMLFYGSLTQSQTPDNGDTVEYADGALDITMD